MLPQIFYFDIFLGRPDQAPSAWIPIRAKVAALTSAKALDVYASFGYDRLTIMRTEKFVLKACNGSTVAQYKLLDIKDTDALLLGVGKVLDEKPVIRPRSRKR